MFTKEELLKRGQKLIKRFCKLNKISEPKVNVMTEHNWAVGACAYYRPETITICLSKCQHPCGEKRNRNWSWPGNTVDRTPYGVLAHELGHHCDYLTGETKYSYSSNYCEEVMAASGETQLTGYCDNPAEWFAEMFRLFVTNPLLLQKIRPKTFSLISEKFKPLKFTSWKHGLLEGVPDRVINTCETKIIKAGGKA